MASTMLLDTAAWDLVLDADGNIALATEPYSLAQDAASAIKTFAGECYWDTTIGVPYRTAVLGKQPSLAAVKELLVNAALTVTGVASAQTFLTSISERGLTGQVQVVSDTGEPSVAAFVAASPQGIG